MSDEFIVKFETSHKCDYKMVDAVPENSICRVCGKSIMADISAIEPEQEGPLEFKKYPSIDQSYRTRMIHKIIEGGFNSIPWVAVNKIHGANFSVLASADDNKFAKRTCFLDPAENFYGYQRATKMLRSVAKDIQSYYGKNIIIYMEFFGGTYPHSDVRFSPDAVQVQKEVKYCPFNDVRVLDIFVGNEFLDWDEMIKIAPMFGLKVATELVRGSFEQMLELDPVFPDPMYKEYNLPPLEGNFSEGYVLRPVKECKLHSGERVMLKHKNPAFMERKHKAKTVRDLTLPEHIQEIIDNLEECITNSRIKNVISHGEEFTNKSFGRIMGLVVQDIMKEEWEDVTEGKLVTKEEVKQLNKLLNMRVANYIRPFFMDIIDGTF